MPGQREKPADERSRLEAEMVLAALRAVRTDRERVDRTARELVPKARALGVPVQEIAEALGMTRQGVYFILRG
jgi:hypothetical protein